MATKPKPTDKTPSPSELPSGDSPGAQLDKYLTQTKDDHFNLEKPIARYVLSSGSLNLDSEGILFPPGAFRVGGGPNLGKTPFLINLMDNLLDMVPNSLVAWCLAEGRMSEQNLARFRHPVVYSGADWKPGTVFIFKTNIYEEWLNLKRTLVMHNPTGARYGFVTDSIDSLILKNDVSKPFDEASKVAGAPLLTHQMYQKMGLAMRERGHWSFWVSQKRAEIKLDPYAKHEPRQMAGSGGNALAHNADDVLEFQEWYESDLILEKPDQKPDRVTNRPLGHTLKVRCRKSSNEKRFLVVEIPVKHGVSHGSAIWREREISDQLLGWSLVTRKGSWLSIGEVLKREFAEAKLTDIPDQIQGYNQLCAFLESRKDVTDYLFAKLKSMISSASAPAPVATPKA